MTNDFIFQIVIKYMAFKDNLKLTVFGLFS